VSCLPHGLDDIADDGIRAAFTRPIDSEPLHKIAAGKHRAVIVIDDLSRPTLSDRLVAPVLEELHRGGLKDEEITILVGTANHRTLMRRDLIKKLG